MSDTWNGEENRDLVADSQDNLKVAVDKVAETLDMTVSQVIGDDGPSTKQMIVRTTDVDHERWKAAAQKKHPTNMRRYYPWAEFCLKCNTRLRG